MDGSAKRCPARPGPMVSCEGGWEHLTNHATVRWNPVESKETVRPGARPGCDGRVKKTRAVQRVRKTRCSFKLRCSTSSRLSKDRDIALALYSCFSLITGQSRHTSKHYKQY